MVNINNIFFVRPNDPDVVSRLTKEQQEAVKAAHLPEVESNSDQNITFDKEELTPRGKYRITLFTLKGRTSDKIKDFFPRFTIQNILF